MPTFTYLGQTAVFRTFVNRYTMEAIPTEADGEMMLNMGYFWNGLVLAIDAQTVFNVDDLDDDMHTNWSALLAVTDERNVTRLVSTHLVGTVDELSVAASDLMDEVAQSDKTAELDNIRVSWDVDRTHARGGAGKKRSRAQMTHMLSTLSEVHPEENKTVCTTVEKEKHTVHMSIVV